MNIFIGMLVVAFTYLAGSLCSAVIVSRIFSLPDPRSAGSKNPGATNVLRLAGKKYAVIVLVVDVLKGLLPVLIVKWSGASLALLGWACLGAVLGHIYPIFFGFQGGKGVATALGTFLGVNFLFGVVVLGTWLLVANFTRYSSLASLTAIGLSPFYALFMQRGSFLFFPFMVIVVLVLYKHRDNASRLIDGTEHKISMKHDSLSGEIEATLQEQSREELAEETVENAASLKEETTEKSDHSNDHIKKDVPPL